MGRSLSPRAYCVRRSPLCGDTPQRPGPYQATFASAAHRLVSITPRTVTSGLPPSDLRSSARKSDRAFPASTPRASAVFRLARFAPSQAAASANTRLKTALALPTELRPWPYGLLDEMILFESSLSFQAPRHAFRAPGPPQPAIHPA